MAALESGDNSRRGNLNLSYICRLLEQIGIIVINVKKYIEDNNYITYFTPTYRAMIL